MTFEILCCIATREKQTSLQIVCRATIFAAMLEISWLLISLTHPSLENQLCLLHYLEIYLIHQPETPAADPFTQFLSFILNVPLFHDPLKNLISLLLYNNATKKTPK